MLDKKFILANADAVQKNCDHRGVVADVQRYVSLETQCRQIQQEIEEFARQANELSKSIGKAKDDAEREQRKEEGRRLREQKDTRQADYDRLAAEAGTIYRSMPNMTHPDAPIGEEAHSVELRRGEHEVRAFGFPAHDHVQLADQYDLIDFEGGARIAGAGFYFLKNEAALLELALQQYALEMLVGEGFVPTITPDVARSEILQGVGFIPRGPETQIYSIENFDLNLVATAEITLGGMYSEQVLEAEELPLKLCGISHCFRTEAGAAGRAARGLYRVHQFTKVEMFAFALPDQSDAILEEFCQLECRLFDDLEVPYRVVDTATGDLGGPA
ncbi:MAG: aminoacyl--tRNA ligase-related protein, partial [Bythopirellula sp.]